MKEKIKKLLIQMSGVLTEMVDLVYQGLMENDPHYLNSALNKERILDGLEKEITASVFNVTGGLDERQQKEFILLVQTAENMERMGDELRYLMERIEIKIAEKLYFSDLGIKQYTEVLEKMRTSVGLIADFLNKDKKENLNKVLENGQQIKGLVEKYRVEHLERLTKGICQPRAANMYFDMLDFTGNVARHCTNIARTHKGQ